MFLNYSNIKLDAYNRPETPTLFLQTLSGETIGTLSGVTGLNIRVKYSEPSELNFDISAKIESNGSVIDNPMYKEIVGQRVIHTKVYGNYIIMNPESDSDGIKDEIHVTAYSLEKQWEKKILFLEEGTYNFWNPVEPEKSILGLMIELMPGWSVGYVSPTLIGKYRVFDQYDDYLLDFAYNSIPDKYRCVCVFDTYEMTISAYDVDEQYDTIPIYLDFDNLLENVEVNELTDELVTAISPYGEDNLDIRDVNPIGSNWIYDLSYFISNGDIPSAIATKWDAWQAAILSHREMYYGLVAMRNSKMAQMMSEDAALVDMNGILTGYRNNQSVTAQAIQMEITDEGREAQQEVLDGINQQIEDQEAAIAQKKSDIADLKDEINELDREIAALVNEIKYANYFTDEERATLSNYIIEMVLTEETFVSSTFSGSGQVSGAAGTTSGAVEIEDSSITRISLNEDYGKTMYTFSGGTISHSGDFDVSGDIIRGTLEIGTSDQKFILNAYLGDMTVDDDNYASGIFTLYGGSSNETDNIASVMDGEVETFEGTDLSFSALADTYLYVSTNVSEFEKYSVQLELLDYAQSTLKDLATPSYEFNVDSGNFVFAKEFEQFRDELQLGRGIHLNLGHGEVITPYIIEIAIDFEDHSKLDLVFSNKFKRHDQVNTLKDMIEQSYSSSRSFDASKYTYNRTANKQSEVDKFMSGALDAAKNTIIAAQDQSVVIDGAGIRVNGTITDGQTDKNVELRIVNGMIAMTDDNWNEAKLAIGYFKTDSGSYYGVNADVIAGKLLVGNNLVIENATDEGDMMFKVDSTGAWLYNSQFILQSENGGSIMLHPDYGFAAMNGTIYDPNGVNGATLLPTFIDPETGDIILDSDGYPEDVNFYIDMDGDVYMRGNVMAESGNIGGWTIADNKLYSGSDDAGNNTSTYVALSSSGDNPLTAMYAIWAGKENPADAPFFVKRDGTVSIQNGDFKGGITASTIDGGTIRGSAVSGGSINIGDGNFVVDSSGNVTLNGNITWGPNTTRPVGQIYALYARTLISKPTNAYSTYPATSSSSWHKTLDSENDYYMSFSYDDGVTWTDPLKVRGSDGTPGTGATVTRSSIVAALVNAESQDGLYSYTVGGNQYLGINASAINTGAFSITSNGSTVFYANADTGEVRITGNSVSITAGDAVSNAITAGVNSGVATANSYADSLINNMEVGGRNLLLATGTAKTSTASSSNSAYTDYWYYSDYGENQFKGNTTTQFTISFDYEISNNAGSNSSLAIYPFINGNMWGDLVLVTAGSKGHYKKTGVLTGTMASYSSDFKVRVRLQYASDGATVTVSNLKLEKGTKETDWTPAPEDVNADIATVQNYISTVATNIGEQIDGVAEQWFYAGPPSSSVLPESEWLNPDTREKHLGDWYYDVQNGYAYKYTKSGNTYSWTKTNASGIQTALANAATAQDTADHKRRVFTSTPTPPYDVGDLWVQGSSGDILKCKRAKGDNGTYSQSDWELASKYTDDSALNTWINGDFNTQMQAISGQIDQKADTYYQTTNPATWPSSQNSEHIGDLWWNPNTNIVQYWSGTEWVPSENVPQEVFDQIDGRAQIFTGATLPANADPNEGDLWFQGPDNPILTYISGVWVEYNMYTDDTAIENLEIGGRNLLLDTDAPSLTAVASEYNRYFSDSGVTAITPTYISITDAPIPVSYGAQFVSTGNNTGGRRLCWYDGATVRMVDGQKYTASMYAKVTSGSKMRIRILYGLPGTSSSYQGTSFDITNTQQWERYEWTFTYSASQVNDTNGTGARLYMGANADFAGTVRLCGFQLEKGTKATDWKQAPEDVYISTKAYVDAVTEDLGTQIDNVAEQWFYAGEPTLSNEPAVNWNTYNLRDAHAGDWYYDVQNGYAYKFTKSGSTYNSFSWVKTNASGIQTALANAATAQDTADHKRRVFTAQPTPPYDVGDLWMQGANGDIVTCTRARASGSYNSGDWSKLNKYTDDSALTTFLSGEYETLKTQVDGKADTYYQASDPSSAWTTTALKDQHVGDLWYDSSSVTSTSTHGQKYYQYVKSGSTYSWQEMKATPPPEVFDKIDGKAQIFVSQPTTPYFVGDLWFSSSTSDIMTCINARSSGNYNASDWEKRNKYTDDSALNAFKNGEYATFVTTTGNSINGKTTTYYQSSPPSTHSTGDLWIDTDDGNKLYRWGGSSWTSIQDTGIQEALTAAGTAQATADGKIVTFAQASAPTGADVGDLWIDTDDNNRMHRWNGSQWVAYTDSSAVEELEIGGRNLLLDTNAPSLTTVAASKARYFSDSSNTTIVPTYISITNAPVNVSYGTQYVSASATNTDVGRCICWYSGDTVPMVDGQKYTMSVYAKVTSGSKMRLIFQYGVSSYPKKTIDVTSSSWERYSWTFTYSASSAGDSNGKGARMYVGARSYYAGTLQLCGYKLEKGAKATDWTPAPEDTAAEIEALGNYLDGAFKDNIEGLIDGKAETYYQPADPSSAWTTTALKNQHIGDMWYNTTTNKSCTWSGTAWVESDVPQAVYNKINGKANIFTGSSTPSSPSTGDLWFQGDGSPILTYVSGAWTEYNKYTKALTELEIGGRNLLLDTTIKSLTDIAADSPRFFSDPNTTTVVPSIITVSNAPVNTTAGSRFVVASAQSGNSWRALCWYENARVPFVDGQQYTMSAYARVTSGSTMRIGFGCRQTSYHWGYQDISGYSWKRYSWTFTYSASTVGDTDSGGAKAYFGVCHTYAGTVELCGYQVERGAKATDWKQAPEDSFFNPGNGEGNMLFDVYAKGVPIYSSGTYISDSSNTGTVYSWINDSNLPDDKAKSYLHFNNTSGTGTRGLAFYNSENPPIIDGDYYTISCYARSSTGTVLRLRFAGDVGQIKDFDIPGDNTWRSYEYTGKFVDSGSTDATYKRTYFCIKPTAVGQTLDLCGFKLVRAEGIENTRVNDNLFHMSRTFAGWNQSSTTIGIEPDETEKGVNVAHFSAVSSASWRQVSINFLRGHGGIPYGDVRNKTLTLSYWVKIADTTVDPVAACHTTACVTHTKGGSRFKYSSNLITANIVKATNEWQRMSITFTVRDSLFTSSNESVDISDDDYFYLELYNHSTSESWMKKPKLEFGSVATDWVECTGDHVQGGGRNLLLNSGTTIQNATYNIATYNFGDVKPIEGEPYVLQIKGKLGSDRPQWGVFNTNGTVYQGQYGSPTSYVYTKEAQYEPDPVDPTTGGIYTILIPSWYVAAAANTSLKLFQMPSSGASTSTIEWVKLESGTVPTDWTPAPEDVDGKIDTAQEAADSALSKFGTCTTAAGTKAKVVVCPTFTSLTDGASITVLFTNSNTVATPTLNVNSTGAKTIKFYNPDTSATETLTSTSNYNWIANSSVDFKYDATNSVWLMIDKNGILGQTKVFNSLTKNQANQGLYLDNGNCYVNATYIKTGTLSADRISAGSINAEKLNANSIKTTFLTADNINSSNIKLYGNMTVYTSSTSTTAGGYMGYASGNNGSTTTNGIKVSSADGNNYFIATDGGCRMTASGASTTDVYVTSDGPVMRYGANNKMTVLSTGPLMQYNSTNQILATENGPAMRCENTRVEAHSGTFVNVGTQPTSLGSTSYKWSVVYASSGTINTSDRNQKYDISYDVDKYIDLFDELKPVSYKLIDGQSGRTHLGMIAQDIEELIDEKNISSVDFAAFIKENVDGTDIYGLRYEEFIPILIGKIQRQQQQIDRLMELIEDTQEVE